MTNAQEVLLYILKQIKYKSDLTPARTTEELEGFKNALIKLKKEEAESEKLIASTELYQQEKCLADWCRGSKIIKLYPKDINDCGLSRIDEINDVLAVFKQKKLISNFRFEEGNRRLRHNRIYYEIILSNKSDKKIKAYISDKTKNISDNIKQKIKRPLNKILSIKKWEEVEIKFLNGHEVIIKNQANDKTSQTTYKEMGFKNKRTGLPNRQWELLCALASKNGRLSWENNQDLSIQDRDAIKKRKEILSKTLKQYFGLDKDPFLSYRKEKAYEIKISLIPEASDKLESEELGEF